MTAQVQQRRRGRTGSAPRRGATPPREGQGTPARRRCKSVDGSRALEVAPASGTPRRGRTGSAHRQSTIHSPGEGQSTPVHRRHNSAKGKACHARNVASDSGTPRRGRTGSVTRQSTAPAPEEGQGMPARRRRKSVDGEACRVLETAAGQDLLRMGTGDTGPFDDAQLRSTSSSLDAQLAKLEPFASFEPQPPVQADQSGNAARGQRAPPGLSRPACAAHPSTHALAGRRRAATPTKRRLRTPDRLAARARESECKPGGRPVMLHQ